MLFTRRSEYLDKGNVFPSAKKELFSRSRLPAPGSPERSSRPPPPSRPPWGPGGTVSSGGDGGPFSDPYACYCISPSAKRRPGGGRRTPPARPDPPSRNGYQASSSSLSLSYSPVPLFLLARAIWRGREGHFVEKRTDSRTRRCFRRAFWRPSRLRLRATRYRDSCTIIPIIDSALTHGDLWSSRGTLC